MERRLIYDVGVNDGADTAFYLAQGFRVVGIEASPALASMLRARFSAEIADEAFVLLNVGVAAEEGEATFWISDQNEWSSFNLEIASRNGVGHRPVIIPTVPFGSIIAEHGVPHYCKIDIEGNDWLCLAKLTPETSPTYISIEMSHQEGSRDLQLLRSLGYTKFKIVSQVTRAQPSLLLTWLGYALPPKAARFVRRATGRLFGVKSINGWYFEQNSSGPFAEDTPGPWRSYDQIVRVFGFLKAVDIRFGANGLGEWFDIHATR
jgi:FkbM family methyltransferase